MCARACVCEREGGRQYANVEAGLPMFIVIKLLESHQLLALNPQHHTVTRGAIVYAHRTINVLNVLNISNMTMN